MWKKSPSFGWKIYVMVEPRILSMYDKLCDRAMRNYTFEHLNSIKLKHYSQTCSNDHLCKITNVESAQANSHTFITVEDDKLSNATSGHFFSLPNKK